jgi:hypothetical protein
VKSFGVIVSSVTYQIIKERDPTMAYSQKNTKGVTYHLNSKMVVLRGGKEQRIFYFSKDVRPENVDLPDGYSVQENPRNGFLTVKRDR